VQGIPLGLELAAAWVELLPIDEIATEITRNLDFLETHQVDVPDRQRSLRAVFETSWKYLSSDEQDAFLSLCVFVGSFSHVAAEQVSGASLRTLLGLAHKSWLQQTGDGRLELHELMRQYGEERLRVDKSAWREAKQRHADYFSSFVAEQSKRMQSLEQLAGLSAIKDEFNTNIKAAWDWLVSKRCWNDLIENMLLGLFQYSTIREQMDEMIRWLRVAHLQLASETGAEERTAFAILCTLEVCCEVRVDTGDASLQKRLMTIWHLANEHGLSEAMGFWFVILAGMVQTRNLDPDAEKKHEKIIARLREQNDLWSLGTSLLIQTNWWEPGRLFNIDEDRLLEASQIFKNLGVVYEQYIVATLLGYHSIAQRRGIVEITHYFQLTRQFLDKMGDRYHSIDFLNWVWIYFQKGESEQGFSFIHEEQRIFERLGNLRSLAFCQHWESMCAVRYSTFEHALETRLHALEIARRLDLQTNIAWWLFELGEIYRVFGRKEKALNLYEQARTSFEKMNMVLGLGFYQRAHGDIALGKARYTDALAFYQDFETRAAQDNNTWSLMQAHAKLALVYAYLENCEQARLEVHKALALSYDRGFDDVILQALLAEPACLIQEGKDEQAVELAAFIFYHPASWNETRQHALGILETASHNLNQDMVRAALELGKTLDFDSIIAELIKSK
jgi:tetratricopeptide (TPR) repeat protein